MTAVMFENTQPTDASTKGKAEYNQTMTTDSSLEDFNDKKPISRLKTGQLNSGQNRALRRLANSKKKVKYSGFDEIMG